MERFDLKNRFGFAAHKCVASNRQTANVAAQYAPQNGHKPVPLMNLTLTQGLHPLFAISRVGDRVGRERYFLGAC